MPSVLLTRPQTTSALLAKELQRQGYRAMIEPLLTIHPTGAPRPSHSPDAVMITSANALAALEENGAAIDDFLALPCFCVGARTAEKARAFGFQNAEASHGDGAELAALIGARLKEKNAAILHIAGRDTDSKAADGLRQSGFAVLSWPVYTALPAAALTPKTIEALKNGQLDAVLLFSARTAETLNGLLKHYGLEACCRRMSAIGLSEAVTARLQPLPWKKLAAAPAPTEDAMLACLKETLSS